jgi:hypothetical protein
MVMKGVTVRDLPVFMPHSSGISMVGVEWECG